MQATFLKTSANSAGPVTTVGADVTHVSEMRTPGSSPLTSRQR